MKEEQSGKMVETDHGAYYYHPDHLGSSSVVTDKDGKFYESLEYFPFGETWIHNKVSSEQQSTPYKYTSKEQDKETGWYYFGDRYLDVRLSRWIAADPPLRTGEYLPKADDLDTDHDYYWQYNNDETAKLPGMGGVYNPINLDAYQYGGQNPVRLVDADGNLTIVIHGTYAYHEQWATSSSEFSKAVGKTFGEKTVLFKWAGAKFYLNNNNHLSRLLGALSLHNCIKNYNFKKGEKLNIVAHSHGGNVVKLYTKIKGARKIDTLVNLGTPQRGDYEINPAKVDKYINAYSTKDWIQRLGGRLPILGIFGGRKDPHAHNLNITDKASGHAETHSAKAWPKIEKSIKE